MSSNVGGVSSAGNAGGNSGVEKRPSFVTVKRGENLTIIAKRYGMSKAEFVKWTGLKGVIRVGQKIELPVDSVEAGKGIYALARKYGMTMAEFSKMNNISDPQNYAAKAGEVFYVKPAASSSVSKSKKKASGSEVKPQSSKENTQSEAKSDLAAGARVGAVVGIMAENMQKYGSTFTPQELAEKIYKIADSHYGAVGRPDFDALINEINEKNVEEVLDAYTKLKDNDDKDSLIYTITHEIRSDKQARKDAAMKVYDALARAKNAPAEKREEFEKELDAQFDKWIGMVNTEKLDKVISEITGNSDDTTASASSSSGHSQVAKKAVKADGRTVVTKPTKGASKTLTTTDLQRGAIASAKAEATQKFKEYCKANGIKYNENMLDLSPLDRIPAPATKGTSITSADSGILPPTGKPNGKVIILNPGHGGYSSRSGYFDPGSYSFIKKGNGKYAPLLEYDKMKIYGDSTVEKLRAKGYSVVLTNGHAQTISDQHTISNIVSELKNGSRGKKYADEDIMFISLHADSEPSKKGSGVCYDSRFANDRRLAQLMQSNLNEAPWVTAGLSERNWNVPKKGLQVLHQTETIPSVLLEVEYVNGARCQNLDSYAYQQQFEDKMIEGIDEYFGFNQR